MPIPRLQCRKYKTKLKSVSLRQCRHPHLPGNLLKSSEPGTQNRKKIQMREEKVVWRERDGEREREEAGKQAAKLYENLHNCSIDSFTTLVGLRFPCAKAKSGYVMSCWKLESCQFSYLRHLLHLGLDSPILYSSHSSSSSSLFTLPTFNNTTPSKLSSWHPIFTTFTQKNRLLSSFLPSFLPSSSSSSLHNSPTSNSPLSRSSNSNLEAPNKHAKRSIFFLETLLNPFLFAFVCSQQAPSPPPRLLLLLLLLLVFLLSFSGSPWTLVSFVKQKKKQERQQANNVKIWTQKEAEKMRAQINNN